MSLQDRIVGMYVGGILGDALGVPIEHLSKAEIRRRFGNTVNAMTLLKRHKPPRLSDESTLLLHSISHFSKPDISFEESLGQLHERGEQSLQNTGFSRKMRSLIAHYRQHAQEPNPHRDNPGSGFVPLALPLVQQANSHDELRRLLREYVPKTHQLADPIWTEHYFGALFGILHGEPIIRAIGSPSLEEIAQSPRLAAALSGNVEKIKEVEGDSESILSTALALYNASNRNFEKMLKLALSFDQADYDTLFFAAGALIGAAVGYNALPKELVAQIKHQIPEAVPKSTASRVKRYTTEQLKEIVNNNDLLMSEKGKRVLFELIPELELQEGYESCQPRHCYQLLEHTLRTAQELPNDTLLRIAGLLHDVAKPFVREQTNGHASYHGHAKTGSRMAYEIMARLGFSKEDAEIVSRLVAEHVVNYKPEWTDNAVRRFARRNNGLMGKLFSLVEADNSAQLPGGSLQELAQRIKYLDGLRNHGMTREDGMPYVRRPDEVLGEEFVRMRSEGEIELATYLMPEAFEPLRETLGFKYGFTNKLQPNSCLILQDSDELTAVLAAAPIPTLFLDSRISPESHKMLDGKGTVLKGKDSSNHYQTLAEIVAQSQGPSILYVNAVEWCNEELQRTLIARGKHFEVGLPDVKITDPAPMHYDPNKYNR